jgi:hypothetical protein
VATSAYTIEKIAAFAPMQSASVSRVTAVNPRSFQRRRAAYLTSPADPDAAPETRASPFIHANGAARPP